MKKTFTLACSALMALNAGAQITISHSQYSAFTPGADTFRKFTTPAVTPMPNGTWDLSAATYGSTVIYTKTPYTNASLPGVTFLQDGSYNFANLTYQAKIGYGITPQGFGRLGEVIDRQAYPLGAVTMNNNDSLVFPTQLVPYSALRNNLSFPITAGSSWTSDIVINTAYQITVAAYGLNATPGVRRSRLMERDTVAGWGKVRVKRLDGSVSDWVNVLAVKTIVEVKDSFFLAGNPAPAPLLTALGLSQGMLNYEYRINYFRSGEVEPLVYTRFADATFTNSNYSDVHVSRLPQPVGIASLPNGVSDVRLFPNPANGPLFIEVTETAAGTWSYQLLNSTGGVVGNASLQLHGGKASIPVQHAAPGSYFLRLSKDGQPVAGKPLVITN